MELFYLQIKISAGTKALKETLKSKIDKTLILIVLTNSMAHWQVRFRGIKVVLLGLVKIIENIWMCKKWYIFLTCKNI